MSDSLLALSLLPVIVVVCVGVGIAVGFNHGVTESAKKVHAGEITIKAEPFVVTYQCKEVDL